MAFNLVGAVIYLLSGFYLRLLFYFMSCSYFPCVLLLASWNSFFNGERHDIKQTEQLKWEMECSKISTDNGKISLVISLTW